MQKYSFFKGPPVTGIHVLCFLDPWMDHKVMTHHNVSSNCVKCTTEWMCPCGPIGRISWMLLPLTTSCVDRDRVWGIFEYQERMGDSLLDCEIPPDGRERTKSQAREFVNLEEKKHKLKHFRSRFYKILKDSIETKILNNTNFEYGPISLMIRWVNLFTEQNSQCWPK